MPEKYSLDTALNKKKLKKRLQGDMVEYKSSMNVLSLSKFMKKYRTESVYYGRVSGDEVQLFYHRAKKRDGGSTGFYGKMTETEKGCLLEGKFRKPLYAYISAAVLVLFTLLCALGTYAGGSVKGALIFLGIGALGVFLMLFDNHKKYIKMYLDKLDD